MVARLLGWLTRFPRWPSSEPPVPPRIEIDAAGFSLRHPDGRRTLVPWTSVWRVATFKYDNWAVDEIVLAFETVEHPGVVMEVSEDWPGFGDLFGPLEQELGISPDWYNEVMQPPLATNYRVIFERRGRLTASATGLSLRQ